MESDDSETSRNEVDCLHHYQSVLRPYKQGKFDTRYGRARVIHACSEGQGCLSYQVAFWNDQLSTGVNGALGKRLPRKWLWSIGMCVPQVVLLYSSTPELKNSKLNNVHAEISEHITLKTEKKKKKNQFLERQYILCLTGKKHI